MKKILIISICSVLVLAGVAIGLVKKYKKEEITKTTCLNIPEHVYNKEGYNYVDYLGVPWMVIPSENHTFEALLTNSPGLEIHDKIAEIISLELMALEDAESIRVKSHTPDSFMLAAPWYEPIFALPNNRPLEENEKVTWWYNDQRVIRLLTSQGYEDIVPSFCVLTIHDMQKFLEK